MIGLTTLWSRSPHFKQSRLSGGRAAGRSKASPRNRTATPVISGQRRPPCQPFIKANAAKAAAITRPNDRREPGATSSAREKSSCILTVIEAVVPMASKTVPGSVCSKSPNKRLPLRNIPPANVEYPFGGELLIEGIAVIQGTRRNRYSALAVAPQVRRACLDILRDSISGRIIY